jgi:hypothetical protein
VAKVGPSANRRFVFDPSGRLMSELPGVSTATKMEYIYLGSEPVVVVVDPDGDAATGAGCMFLARTT